MSVATVPGVHEQRFRISGVSWEKYEQMAEWFSDRHVRVTYDRGELEIMTLSHEHEHDKHVLGAFVLVLADELDIDLDGGGSMTFKKEELERGLEPDECYWVENEPKMRGKRTFDPATDPPPDLVIEVEISRSVLDRMGIFAAIKIQEVWRWDGRKLSIYLLRQGRYVESSYSRSFPFLPVAEFSRFLTREATGSQTKLLRAFRQWVREQQEQGWPTAPPRPHGARQLPRRSPRKRD